MKLNFAANLKFCMKRFLRGWVLVLIVLFSTVVSFASTDTLKIYAKKLIDQVSIEEKSVIKNYCSLVEVNKIGYQLSNDSIIAASLNNMVDVLRQMGNYEVALDSGYKGERLFASLSDSCGLIDIYNSIGICYFKGGDLSQAIDYFNRSIEIGLAINDQKQLANGLLNASLVHLNTSSFDESEACINKALPIFIKLNDQEGVASCYENLGLINTYCDKYPEALKLLEQALKIYQDNGFENSLPSIYDNIGFVYENMGNLELASKNYRLCIDIAKQQDLQYFYAFGLVDIGRAQMLSGDYSSAIINLVKGNELALEIKSREIVSESYNALSEYYLRVGRPYKSREMLLEYIDYYKKNFNETTSKHLKSLQRQLNNVKKDMEKDQLQASLEMERLKSKQASKVRVAYLVAIIMLIFLLCLSIYTAVNNKRRTEREKLVNQKLKDVNEELETMVEARTKELSLALDKVRELERIKNAFMSNVSHEIRTPLNGLLGFSRFLVSGDLTSEEKAEYGVYIERLGNRLLRILDDVLELSKIETNQVEVQYDDCNINSIVDLMYSDYSESEDVRNKKLQFKSHKALPDVGAFFKVDSFKLKRILENLIENALKFTHQGSVEFGYSFDSNKTLRFFVRDTGIGIPKEAQTRVFERFYRHVNTEKPILYEGAGVGLTIAKGFAIAMGGRIELESEQDKGSTFYLILPQVQIVKSNTNNSLEGKVILLVEDDMAYSQLVESMLISEGAHPVHVKNAEDAIEICNISPKIDAVLLDLQLPFMNGYEVAKILKHQHPKLPIIAQSASTANGEAKLSREMGCDAFIAKPTDSSVLFATLRTAIC